VVPSTIYREGVRTYGGGEAAELYSRYHVVATANNVYVFDLYGKKGYVSKQGGDGKISWDPIEVFPGLPNQQ
jgi:hypothetical protein